MEAAGVANEADYERKALERLVVENDDLERLESLIAEFNIFEALGVVRAEVRHSKLLAFLLDPSRPHGLNDTFLRRLLQRALVGVPPGKASVLPVELDVLDLDEVEVRSEWSNIDILVLDPRNKLVIIIENKIDSGEHSNQLQRYWSIVEQEFPEHRIVGLFLTPDSNPASDDRYLPIDYKLVANIVKRYLETRASTIGPDVQTMLRHYEQMLRRYIVNDSDIAVLCRSLYRKHRQAFDLIFEHRPDAGQGVARDFISKLIQDDAGLVLDECTRANVRFAPKRWDVSAPLQTGNGWTKTKRILLFQFALGAEKVILTLHIGPGTTDTRERLFNAARRDRLLSKATGKTLEQKWNQIYTRTFLDSRRADVDEPEAIEAAIREQWVVFTTKDLPAINSALDAETWLWPDATPPAAT